MFYFEDIGDADDDDDDDLVPIKLTNITETDNVSPDSFDEYIGAQLMLPNGDGCIQGTVTERIKSDEGLPIRRRNLNPVLDTWRYEVELSDATTAEYFANVIAENIFSQVDVEGRHYVILREIKDHKRDETAVDKEDGWITMKSGQCTQNGPQQGGSYSLNGMKEPQAG